MCRRESGQPAVGLEPDGAVGHAQGPLLSRVRCIPGLALVTTTPFHSPACPDWENQGGKLGGSRLSPLAFHMGLVRTRVGASLLIFLCVLLA